MPSETDNCFRGEPQVTTRPHGAQQRWRVLAASAIALGGVLVSPSQGGATVVAAAAPAPATRVIVQAADGSLAAVKSAAESFGAHVVSTQQSLDTVVVDLPANRLDDLRHVPGVRAATQDMLVHLSSLPSVTGSPGDISNVAVETGATDYWRDGFFGQGVDVALLDSGVLPVNGLLTPNKLVIGPDLSRESQSPSLRGLDTFGHGTHMAGIIGGLDTGLTPGNAVNNPDHFVGMAPASRIVSIKLADAHGQTDVSQVVAGIGWVIDHAHDRGLNIRVLNLSFGTDPAKDGRLDPLEHAAEVAWDRGIVVVVSAGNGGNQDDGLASPALSSDVLAVGSLDTHGTTDTDDDTVASFSKRGNSGKGKRGPDVVAPGVSLVSLRASGSYIDQTQRQGRVGERFFKGSGTSQSAAVVSGAAALMLSQRPQLTPDQVRDALRKSARSLDGASHDAQGAGAIDLSAAQNLVAHMRPGRSAGHDDSYRSWGKNHQRNGRWSRADDDWDGDLADGAYWDGTKWSGATWAGATWAGATWASDDWDGATWAGATWAGATWAGATWAGATWADADWADADWASAGWE
jgi:serine protease AprX